MGAMMDLVELHPEGERQERFRFEYGGGKVGTFIIQKLIQYPSDSFWLRSDLMAPLFDQEPFSLATRPRLCFN